MNIASIESKLIAIGLAMLVLIGVGVWIHHTGFTSGQFDMQAQWDKVKASQAAEAITASEVARKTEHTQATDFATISSTFQQAAAHVYPSLSDTLPAAVTAGTLRLRDRCPAASASGGVPIATARSRIADAASTAALAQRTADSIAVVRVGDAADKREIDYYRPLIISLRAALQAERKP